MRATAIRHLQTGQEIVEDILAQDPNHGGRQVIITGQPGSGKTTLMYKMLMKLQEKGEIVIWRGRQSDNLNYIPDWKKRVKVFHHEKDEIKILEVEYGSKRGKDVTHELDIVTYKDAQDLLDKLDPTRINVVYEPSFYTLTDEIYTYIYRHARVFIPRAYRKYAYGILFWFELFARLLEREGLEWISLFIDEADDLFPSSASDLLWKLIDWVKNSIKDFRKSLVTLVLAVHNINDLDDRIVKKIPVRIYLQGAIAPKDSSMKTKNIGQFLKKGDAKVEWKGRGYGGFTFDPLPPVTAAIKVKMKWTGPVPSVEEETGEEALKKNWTQIIDAIATVYSPMEALEFLELLRKYEIISEPHYYRLKRRLKKKE